MQSGEQQEWTELEDNALRTFYPAHGRHWPGWAEVLPGRTERAISSRASRIGVAPSKPEPRPSAATAKKRPAPPRLVGQSGYDDYVMRCMRAGMAPSQMDSMMGWWPGKAARIITAIWEKDRDR